MHIFLTGEKHIGKSTLVNRVLAEIPGFGGIRSVSVFDSKGNRNVYLTGACDPAPVTVASRLGGICAHAHVVEKHPEVFDSYGLSLLEGSRLIVIDEIGNMERDAQAYSDKITELVGRKDVFILGVVQKMARTPLAEFIRSSGNVEIVEVTVENRDTVFDTLLRKVRDGMQDQACY